MDLYPDAELATSDKISGWLGDPGNQAAMLAMGKGLSQPRIMGGKLVPGVGSTIADAMLPIAQGQIAQQGTQGAAGAVGQAATPNVIQQGGIYGGTKPKFSDTAGQPEMQDLKFGDSLPVSLLGNKDFTGFGYTVKPDGTKSWNIKSTGPKDYAQDPIQGAIQAQYDANGITQRRNFSEDVGTVPFASRPGQGGGQAQPVQTPSLAGNMMGVKVPSQYAVYYQSAANKYNVPLNLLLAVHKNESNFDPEQVSPKGAIGLGQVMPDTGRMMGVTDPAQLKNPLINIDTSAKYIRHLADRYGIDLNNPAQVAMAYNGGPNGMRNADMDYVQRVTRDAGGNVELAEMRSPGASTMPAIRQVQATSMPGVDFSPYRPPNFSNMPSLRGLSPEEVAQVYKSGTELARAPATIGLENARAESDRADAAIKRLGLPAATPVEIDGVITTGEKALAHKEKLLDIESRKQYYSTLAENAETRADQAKYLNELRIAQTEERQAIADAKKNRNKFIADHADEKPPGSDLTWAELDATGNIERYLGHREQANTAAIQQSKLVAAAAQKIRTDIMKKYTEQLGGLRILEQEAKAKKFKSADDYINAQVHSQMSDAYGPGWRAYLTGEQGGPSATQAAPTLKYNPATGRIE